MMNIKLIRRYLVSKIGYDIVVIYYGSRNKKERYKGILCNVYLNVFTIKLGNDSIKCFNLCDVLTKTVQIYI